jgi:hypothetical protein
MDLIVRKNGRWPLATKEGVLGMMTGVWSWRCGMCFAPVFRGETFRVVLGRGVRSTPASDDGVHLVSGPGSLLSLEKQHLAGSAALPGFLPALKGRASTRLKDEPVLTATTHRGYC